MKRRILATLLLLIMLLPLVISCGVDEGGDETTPEEIITTETPKDETPQIDTEPNAVIFASADFQGKNTVGGTSATGSTSDPNYNNGNKVASEILTRIIQNIKKDGYTQVDTTIFCGDYDIDNGNKATDSKAGIDAVKKVYTEMEWDKTPSGAETKHIFLQGNHEVNAPIGTNGLSGSNRDSAGKLGAFDGDHYGVYLLHEDYFPYKSSGYTDQKIDSAAAELKEYLDAKLAEGYSKPIFIAAHVPLHYNLWMASGLYAKPFFDVINEAAGKGLNIIYLFGHDHGGYDQYLGGTDIYLPAGSAIIVPDRGTKASKQTYQLNFTYMTAGLCAYTIGDHSENQLSGTVFEIYDDRVVIRRYNDSTDRANNGLTNVGCVGEGRADNTAAGLLHTYYSTEYNSPQTLSFKTQSEVRDSESGVTVRGFDVTSVSVTAGMPSGDGDAKRIAYDVCPTLADGSAYNGFGTVTLPLLEGEELSAVKLTATVDGKACALLSSGDGELELWVPSFGRIEVTYTPIVRLTCKRVTASELKDGGRYLIIAGKVQDISSKYNKHILSPEPLVLSSPERVGLAMIDAGIGDASVPDTITVEKQYVFTLKKDSATGDWLIGDEDKYLQVGTTSGSWVSSGEKAYRVRRLEYGTNGTPFKVHDHDQTGMVYFSTTVDNGAYPCYLYVTSYGNSCAMDLKMDVTEISPSNVRISYYYIYEVIG